MDLIAYRLYVGDNSCELTRLLSHPLPDRTCGMVFLCGQVDFCETQLGLCRAVTDDLNLASGWNTYYLGEGKEGYTSPWRLLFEVVRRNADIQRVILSDADDQISQGEALRVLIGMTAPLVLPQRNNRHFGAYTFERNIIEDIENAFVRYATNRFDVLDLQSGLYVFQRELVDKVSFEPIRNTKWIGDLYLVQKIFSTGIPVQQIFVDSSKEHNGSCIFDYASPLNEILMGLPAFKMKELVDYFGLSLMKIKEEIHAQPNAYLHTLTVCPDLKAKGKQALADVLAYVDFIVGLYQRTAEIYGFTI